MKTLCPDGLKPQTCPTAGLTLLGFREELEVHIFPSFHPNPLLPAQSHPTGSKVMAGGAAAPVAESGIGQG